MRKEQFDETANLINNTKNTSSFRLCKLAGIVLIVLIGLVIVIIDAITLSMVSKGNSNDQKQTLYCDIIILGGGIGGLFGGYQLVPFYGAKVCIVEKNAKLGGRIDDYVNENGLAIGLLALRILGYHKIMQSLAKTFNIELQVNSGEWGLAFTRGMSFVRNSNDPKYDSNMCRQAFNGLKCDYPNGEDPALAMLRIMQQEYIDDPSIVDEAPDFVTYVSKRWTPEGLKYLQASIRYASDFVNSLDTRGMFDFYFTELKDMGFDPQRYYPVGGMSQFIIRLEKIVNKHRGRIFKQEEVLKIEKYDDGYSVTTSNYIFKAKKIISTIPPVDLIKVKGEIATKITSSPQFQSIVPSELATVTVWYNNTWWTSSKNYNSNISTITTTDSCFNAMDIFSYPYAAQQHAIRAVYDDGKCVQMWKMLYESNNIEMLQKIVNSGLRQVFPDIRVFPKPKHMILKYVYGAWYYLHSQAKYTLEEIYEWSQDPFGDGSFSMAGDGYNLSGTAWCEGSVESIQQIIDRFYELKK